MTVRSGVFGAWPSDAIVLPARGGADMAKISSNNGMQKWIVACGAAATFAGAAGALWPVLAAENAPVPNFGMDSKTGWIPGVPMRGEPIREDFLPPPSRPGPAVSAKDHPYIDNQFAVRA